MTTENIFTIKSVLTKDQCNYFIKESISKGWKNSSPSGGGHGRTGREDPRTNKFCILFENDISRILWSKIRPNLSENLEYLGNNVYFNSITKGTEWKPISIYDKMRIYKYNEGDSFPEHLDYKVKRTVYKNGKKYIQQSFLTLLIYLNDNFTGGETGYWPDHNGIHCRFLRKIEKQSCKKDHQLIINPEVGKAVIQDQNILHEGLPPKKGIKYILRTDIIHEKECLINDNPKNIDYEGKWERLFETSCKNYAD